MKPREILGYLIAAKGAGMSTVVALIGLNPLVINLPWAVPILWALAIIGLFVMLGGLGIAASAESAET